MKNSHRWFANLLLVFAVVGLSLSWVTTARAQNVNGGAIGGTVFDASGAVVPGATVVVHNNGTNLDQTQVTDTSGFYKAVFLTPAVYTVTVTAKGFETFKAEQVVVSVGSVTNISPHLTVGGTTQTVTITGAAPLVNVTSSDYATTLNQTAISNLPIQRPRWSNFALLTPGVVNDSNGFGLLSFRGMSALGNNTTIDGAANTQAFFAEERGRTRVSYSSSEASIQEFQVNTLSYSAEYGGAAGGVINTVTKSGTNQLHGELFYRNRENGWASRNPFATITEPTASGGYAAVPFKPKDYWDMWSAAFGGPLKKDKLFFFIDYDGFYRNFPGNAVATSPSVFLAQPVSAATFAGAGGTCTAKNNTSPGAVAGVTSSNAIFPNSNVYNATVGACAIAGIVVEGTANPLSLATGVTDYNNGLAGLITMLGSNARTGSQDIVFPKLDWQINTKNRASFEVNRMRWASPYGVQTQVTNTYSNGAAFGNDYVSDTWGVGKLDSFISPTLANEFRFQLGRDFEFETEPNPAPYEVGVLQTTSTSGTYPLWANYTNPTGFPTYVTLTNGFNFGAAYYDTRYAYPNELRSQFSDTLTWTHGNHTLKFGEDFSHINDKISDIYQQNGSFSYSSVSAYLEDFYAPAACSGHPCASNYNSLAQGFGTLTFNVPNNTLAFFAQDDWKATPRLSLSFGLRWEYEHLASPFFPNPAIPSTTTVPNYKKDFGPRIGFAWDVFGDGKTAVRGGFGLYNGLLTNGIAFGVLTQSGLVTSGIPQGQPSYSFTSAALGGPYFPEVLSTQPTTAAVPAAMYYNSHMKPPEIDEADLVLERNLGWNTVLSVAYMGAFGHFLPQYTDDNILPGTNSGTAAAPNCAGANSTLTYFVSKGGPLSSATYTTPLYACRPNPNYTQMIDIFGVSSNYNALVIQVNHRMSNSVQFNSSYTWSHDLDYGASSGTNLTATSGFGMVAPNNIGAEYGNSALNVPSRWVFSMVANSPWHVNGPLRYLADGWAISPIFTAQDGLPFTDSVSGTAPSALASGGGVNGSDGTFRLATIPRAAFTQPGLQEMDLRLSKSFHLKEKVTLELLGEAFNLFNHFNAQGVNASAYSILKAGNTITDTTGATQTCSSTYNASTNPITAPCLSANTAFGSVTAANSDFAYSTRQIQIGIRLKF
ncbi:MAG: carboxypeptidase regulatory-like domain-containing protein [Terriglobia bacterium]